MPALAPLSLDGMRHLHDLTPESVSGANPAQFVTPRRVELRLKRDEISQRGVEMFSQSSVTYQVPAGYRTFRARIVYSDYEGVLPQPAKSLNRIRLQVLLDDAKEQEFVFDQTTPPVDVTFDVTGRSRIELVLTGLFAWDRLVFLDAGFLPAAAAQSSAVRPEPAQAHASWGGVVDERLFQVLRPDTCLPLLIHYAGQAHGAEVRLEYIPEQEPASIQPLQFRVPLHNLDEALAAGGVWWRPPQWFGPATLSVKVNIGNDVVHESRQRVAMIRPVDPASLADSTFALHASWSGITFEADRYAHRWGAKWARVAIRWEVVERRRGIYDFARITELVNTYSAQGFHVMGVLGEKPPSWASANHYAEWEAFVEETVSHFRGQIRVWDVFNEIDVKYFGYLKEFEPDADLILLRGGIFAIRRTDPAAQVVCCSTGTTSWLLYYTRLFDAGLLGEIDIVSLHPYQRYAPEQREGFLDYVSSIEALRSLMRQYGFQKPIWSTEANWILGPEHGVHVTASGLSERTQARYVTRVNLLSAASGVPYFLHAPFFHSQRRQLHLDTLAAYANMAATFANVRNMQMLLSEDGVFAVGGSTSAGYVTALWSTVPGAAVGLPREPGGTLLDLYGNPLQTTTEGVTLSAAPIYLISPSGTAPSVSVARPATTPQWSDLPEVGLWIRTEGSTYLQQDSTLIVSSRVSQYDYQLRSPELPVQPDSCYQVELQIALRQGAISVLAVNAEDGSRVDRPAYLADMERRSRQAIFRFCNRTATAIQIVISNANLEERVSEFELSRPRMAVCPSRD